MKFTMKSIAVQAINANALAIFTAVFTGALCLSAVAQIKPSDVTVKDAWIRTTVPGQKGTGAFMTIVSKDGAKLLGGSSPVAGVTEIHEMKMDGDIMRMRAVQGGLDLPAGKTVELKPGSYHLMLLDLKTALPKDTTVPVTLLFKDAKGVESKVELTVPVATLSPGAKSAGGAAMDMNQHKH
jgi:periplasmic copper chaperone A